MSALRFARNAFGSEKPHSSITDWVDILTGSGVKEEAYDGIPELVDAISLQVSSGPAEASRALRKKLKHGNVHQQYRALVILKALVENSEEKFRRKPPHIFQDGNLTDALKHLATNPDVDKRVKKKLNFVLGSWHEQYKDDPNMHFVAGILKYSRGTRVVVKDSVSQKPPSPEKDKMRQEVQRKKEKMEGLKKEKQKRASFNFETEKPKVMESIVQGSQASSNLVNAIMLVNRKTDSLEKNERVQECLEQAKKAKKPIVRYIQLVENEDIIGTLIETNDRLVAALEMYEELSKYGDGPEAESTLANALAATRIGPPATAVVSPFNGGERGTTGKKAEPVPHLHPDLEDLNFGPIGATSSKLPAPMQPYVLSDEEESFSEKRASLSDFSDYESSDEETHKARGGPSRRNYVTVSDDEGVTTVPLASGGKVLEEDDPFADPFADR